MRNIVYGVLVGIGVLAIGLLVAALMVQPPQAHAQLHNAYWPFSVEVSVRDR